MKLTIVGAGGGIGRHLLDQAIADGHEVTAVVRNPRSLAGKAVDTVTADLTATSPELLAVAFAGADAVLSALGARSKADLEARVAQTGTRSIAAAMRAAEVRRLVVVSATPVGTVPTPARPQPPSVDPGDSFFAGRIGYPVLKAIMRKRYADLARMEEDLRDGDLDWTVIRPVRLTDKPPTGDYRTQIGRNVRRGAPIARADVAHCMLAVLRRPETVRHTVAIAR